MLCATFSLLPPSRSVCAHALDALDRLLLLGFFAFSVVLDQYPHTVLAIYARGACRRGNGLDSRDHRDEDGRPVRDESVIDQLHRNGILANKWAIGISALNTYFRFFHRNHLYHLKYAAAAPVDVSVLEDSVNLH